MHNIVLTILLFIANHEPQPVVADFGDYTSCEIAEGEALTAALHDSKILGVIVVDECRDVGGPAKSA